MHFSLRSRHLRPSLLASSLLLAVSAQGQEKLDVDLPAAPLGQAINALAQQSSVQILFAGDLGAGRQAPALKGRFTPEEALRQLLRDSGLKAQARDEHTFIVVPASEAAVPATQARSEPLDMEQMEITASRTSSDLVSATRQSTVIEHAQLEELRQGSDSLATVLAKAVPGMSDSSRTITEYGQTLPTRPAGGENRAETRLSATSPLTRLGSDGLGGQFQQYFAGSLGALDYSFDFGTRHVGASYDAHGDRIAPEPSQGDLFDSNVYNIGGKLGLRIDENQRVQLALSHYDARQDTDYATDPRVARLPPGSVPANAIKGLELDEQNRIRNTLANLEYENLDILGSRLSAQLYYRDYFTRFTPFDARAVSTRGGNVDQIMQNSEVFGSRLTLRTPLGESGNTELVWGGDYNQERSDMPLDVFDPAAYDASGGLVFDKIGKLTYMPPLRTRSAGAFAQLQHRFDEHWSIDGGLRYEYSTAEFDDFVPLSESKAASPVTVKGGDLDYDAVLSNLGIVYSPVAGQEIYASFSQGFQLPDVGIQLRNARRGFDIGSSNLEPVKTNNYELGWRGAIGGNTLGSLALFYTTSKLGDVQSFNNGLILTRTKERIYGVEASADWLSDDEVWGAGGSATWMRGREKPDGKDWQDMTGYRVPPLKLTAYLQYKPDADWNNRLQATFFDSKDYRLDGLESFGRRQVSTYTTVDLVSQYRITPDDQLSLGIQNLFNRDYYPLYSQLLRNNNNTSHLPAPGTVLTASYTHNW